MLKSEFKFYLDFTHKQQLLFFKRLSWKSNIFDYNKGDVVSNA